LSRAERFERIDAELAQVCGTINVAHARLISHLAEVLESGAWEAVGLRSPTHWVTWKCGVSPARAKAMVALAQRLALYPCVREAFCAGELSEDQVEVICRHTPPACDSDVAELARQLTVPQLRSLLRHYNFDATHEPDDGTEPETPRRTAGFGYTDTGTWRLSAEVAGDEGALAERALDAAKRSLKAAGWSKPSWSDALMAIFDSYLAGGTTRRSGDRRTTMLHVNVDDDGQIGAHLHLGPVVSDAVRRYLTCDSRIRAVFESGGTPINVGRVSDVIADHLRTAVEERDGCCREPGCGRTFDLEVHHIVHWEDGGRTETANLVALCGPSHRRHHLGLLGISGNADDPDGLVFTNARGRVINAAAKPKPPPVLTPAGNWRHPSGESLDYAAVYFSARRQAS
jgi:hypothetical protein